MPAPAIKIEPAEGQWSRPPAELILGVRPKSVSQTTSVVSSSPALFKVDEQLPGALIERRDAVVLEGVEVVERECPSRRRKRSRSERRPRRAGARAGSTGRSGCGHTGHVDRGSSRLSSKARFVSGAP